MGVYSTGTYLGNGMAGRCSGSISREVLAYLMHTCGHSYYRVQHSSYLSWCNAYAVGKYALKLLIKGDNYLSEVYSLHAN